MCLRDEGFDVSKIKGNILYYGGYGLMSSISSYQHGGKWDGMSEADLSSPSCYIAPDVNRFDCPYFHIYANDLTHDVPPCFLVAAELDPLRDDSKLLYEILTNNGIQAEYHEYKGALHAFIHYSKVMDDAEDASVSYTHLDVYKRQEAKTDAWLLLEMVCKIDRSFYYLHMEEDMPEEQMSEYQIALRKRAEHVPLQYIVGETEFMGLKFKVNSSVLIPRQDTETLVEEALKVCLLYTSLRLRDLPGDRLLRGGGKITASAGTAENASSGTDTAVTVRTGHTAV